MLCINTRTHVHGRKDKGNARKKEKEEQRSADLFISLGRLFLSVLLLSHLLLLLLLLLLLPSPFYVAAHYCFTLP